MTVSPRELGTRASVDRAVRSALAATPRSRIGLPIRYSDEAVAAYVDWLAKKVARKAVNAEVIGADASGPVFREGRLGLAVEKRDDARRRSSSSSRPARARRSC